MGKERLQTFSIVFVGVLICVLIVGYDFFAPAPLAIYRVDDLPTESSAELSEQKLDVNTAALEDLMGIKGIGAVTAERIIAYRNTYGGFRYLEELLEIEGIGEKKYESILPFLTIGSLPE